MSGMNVGVYQGAAALSALERWQQTISQNIASSSVAGFKKEETSFASVLGELERIGDGGRLGREVRAVMPGVVNEISMKPGELGATGSELDFAIQGGGFFQIQRPNGEFGYTRDGSFKLSTERTLVTKQGFSVMGDGGPLTLRPGGGKIAINGDGTLMQGDTPIGKIGVFEFENPKSLQRVGEGMLASANPNVQPQAVDRPNVLSGFLESSNVSPLLEMINLVTVARAYEASQKMIYSHDENTGKAIESLGNPVL
jgi:flagellar basal body rod protein FlgG